MDALNIVSSLKLKMTRYTDLVWQFVFVKVRKHDNGALLRSTLVTYNQDKTPQFYPV